MPTTSGGGSGSGASEAQAVDGAPGAPPAAARAPSSGRAPVDRPREAAPWARLLRTGSGKNALAVLDQAVISGASFGTTVLIGRWSGAAELGVFTLGFSLLVIWASIQEALIALPYTIVRHRPARGTEAEFAGSALLQQGLLSLLSLVLLAGAATILSRHGGGTGLSQAAWALACVTPFFLLREFGRRFSFAHLRMGVALLLDVAAALLQMAGLVALVVTDRLTAVTAYAVIGVASGVPFVVWLYLTRGAFALRWRQTGSAMLQSWKLGRWLLAWQATSVVQAYFTNWLLAWLLGVQATGVYAACMTVAQFSNPLILGIANALAPGAANAYNNTGVMELRRVIYRTTLVLGAAMGLFCLAVFLFSEEIIDLLYHGPQFAGHGRTATLLTVAMLAFALGVPATSGLMAVKRADVNFKIALVALGLTLVFVPLLVRTGGLEGAACGILAANVVGLVGRWIAFSRYVPRDDVVPDPHRRGAEPRESKVAQVLREATQDDEGAWTVDQIGEGVQATVYGVPVGPPAADLADARRAGLQAVQARRRADR